MSVLPIVQPCVKMPSSVWHCLLLSSSLWKKESFIFLKVWDHFILLLSWLSTLGLHYFCSTKFYLPSTFEDIVSKGHFILPLLLICKNVKIIIPNKLLIFEQCPYEKILYFKLVGYYISVIGKKPLNHSMKNVPLLWQVTKLIERKTIFKIWKRKMPTQKHLIVKHFSYWFFNLESIVVWMRNVYFLFNKICPCCSLPQPNSKVSTTTMLK